MRDDVELREVIASDLPLFFAWQADPEAHRMAAFTPRDWDAFSVHWAKILADPNVTNRTILFDGQVVGNVACWGEAEERLVGYWIAREYWNRGIASAALALFLGLVRERPLFAHVAKHNHGSCRVLEKCGFTLVGETTVNFAGEGIVDLVFALHAPAATPSPP